MNYLILAIITFLIGSIPTAFLLLKAIRKINIMELGSRNVGAFNAYEVSGSRFLGIVIFIIDAIKGLASVYIAKQFFPVDFMYPMTALFFSVLGHCFSPWIKFKGGRGLATAAGGAIIFVPSIPVIWAVIWVVAYLFRKNIHFGNISATILTTAVALTTADVLNQVKYASPPAAKDITFAISVTLVMLLIMIKHIEPLKEYISSQKETISNRNKR
jgi:glycerol-3-phosphate acyltransferase PlsY